MIKFFRKIRQRLVIENKFRKYIIYALGEIFLIVVGILIAVQIGSWQSEKNNDIVLKRSLSELNQELDQMVWHVSRIKTDISFTSGIIDSIKNRKMSARSLAENFMIVTANISFPTLLSSYERVVQDLSKTSNNYEKSELSRYLNSLKNHDLPKLKKQSDNLELITNNTLYEWSKEPWFEFRHIPDSLINYQHEFLNHYSYRNKLELFSEAVKEYELAFNVVNRNLLSLKIFSDQLIMETNIQNLPQILEKNEFYPETLTTCINDEPIKIQEKDEFGWSHTAICNLSNENIEISEKSIDNGNLVVKNMKILKGEYFISFHGYGNILEFKYPNGECKSVVITKPMSSLILN